MKTALKLNKKQLFELYEKSSGLVKKNLCMEFGESFFITSEVKSEIKTDVVRNSKSKNKTNKRFLIDWEMIFDFTTILRLAIYTCLTWIIFS